ncbi:CrcB protein [Kosakonia radicincitans]|uniref:Fluoride-specific ion channel FluC n=2 Tax=Enterobacteriaceae TaxID=543 RepID=A0AAX2EL67_9ENTR|nr:CrcB protein [Kosakonia radicincitans]SFQ95645.1 CrcB protein [Kosakonia radicincitans]SFT35742.1 CrcB protein [Kosakonia radicincitans]SFX02612.1 CrcB protein [Kosakonia radicincitans]
MTPDMTLKWRHVGRFSLCPSRMPQRDVLMRKNMLKSLFAVIVGGSAGCVIRWLLSLRLNALFPNLPPGTLLVNLLGGMIIGGALAFFTRQPHLDPTWRLLITTGLCGGMTTFSTFSLEIFAQLQTGNYLWAMTSVLVHVLGSLLMTALGFTLINALY